MTAVELFAALVTAFSIWLATRENVWYYPTGIVSVLLYAWIFHGARLYAETGLQFVWLALMIYGWVHWLRGGVGRTELPVTRTPAFGWWTGVICGAVATAAIFWIQRRYTDNAAPMVDSGIAAWSIVAQWMTARKWIESWLFWIVINIAAVPLYITRELHATAALYFVLLILGVKGWRDWRRSLAG